MNLYIPENEKPALPPIWAFGFHQFISYESPEMSAKQIVDTLRSREIPCDCIFLDGSFMAQYRNFAWDEKRFRNPTEKIRNLRENSVKTIAMFDPVLQANENDSIFKEGKQRGYFCKTPGGNLKIEQIEDVDYAFPDFSNPRVRSWWGHLYRVFYSKNRLAGFWNNAVKTEDHSLARMPEATFEGLLKLKNHRRPFVVSKLISGTELNAQPDDELFVRDLQRKVFQPVFYAQSFGEHFSDLAKYAVELRYQLLPYIYTAFWQFTQNGISMIKDSESSKIENDFFFGEQILVSPVVEKGGTEQEVRLPEGLWYYYWTAEAFGGNQQIKVATPLSQIPFFIKGGSVLPHYPIRQTADLQSVDELTLHVYFKHGKESSQLYEDEGEFFNYRKDAFSLKEYEFQGSENEVVLNQNKTGEWIDTYHTCNVLFYGCPFEAKNCFVDGDKVGFKTLEISGNKVYAVTLENTFQELTLKK